MAAHPVTDPAAPQTGRRRFFLSLALCLALLLLRVADLALCTDPATGFVRDSGFALRLAAPLAAALVNWLLARKAAPRPAALLGACPPLGYCLLATGVALGAAAFLYWGDPLAARRYGVVLVVLFCACGALSAVWFLRFGVRAFAPLAEPTAPLPGTLNTLAGAAFFLCALVLRFTVEAASVQRLGCTLRVLSAVMALVFLLSLFRVFLTPGLPVGKKLYAAGFNAFLFCTCHELPQAAFEWAWGALPLSGLAAALVFGLLGAAGLVCAFYASGPAAALPREEHGGAQTAHKAD